MCFKYRLCFLALDYDTSLKMKQMLTLTEQMMKNILLYLETDPEYLVMQ